MSAMAEDPPVEAASSSTAYSLKPIDVGGAVKSYPNQNNNGTASRARSAHVQYNSTARVKPVFESLADDDGELPLTRLDDFLAELQVTTTDYGRVLESIATPGSRKLTFGQASALYGMLSGISPNSPSGSQSSASTSQAARAPLKRVLTKNRDYLGTGTLVYDDAVITYIQKLDDHRKKCEAEGRYAEARAAAKRLADLKTAQVERLRQALMVNQTRELAEVNQVYEEETVKFQSVWDRRIKDYESNFSKAVEDMKASHAQQLDQYQQELSHKRPMRHKPSREYLNHKRIENSLAKTKQYARATKVKEVAEEMYQAELEQNQQAYEAEQRLKVAKYTAKQQQEMEALLQRGARGRDELELRRVSETERRTYRFRNIVMELENLHRLELVQLEAFLDNQVQAGKAVPLKDKEVFKRKREQLLSTQF